MEQQPSSPTKSIQSPTKSDSSVSKKMSMQFRTAQFQEKQTFLCKFCGGAKCKQQDENNNTKLPNAIKGLHSNWITPNIVAMQRPSQRLILKYGVFQQFKQLNITTILNLQEPGEHADCGDGLVGHDGFSYLPQTVYQYGIHFFNQSWQDMTATTAEYMMKIMDIFSHTIEQGGKIAVHCHAGRGRTLLAICSWLIYSGQYTAKESIELAVEKRDGVLSKRAQREFLYEFEKYLANRRQSYFIQRKVTFQKMISSQELILLSRLKSKCDGTPYVHHIIIQQLKDRVAAKTLTIPQIVKGLIHFKDTSVFPLWDDKSQSTLKQFKIMANTMKLKFQWYKDVRILTEAMLDFYEEMSFVHFPGSLCQIIDQQYKTGLQAASILFSPQLVDHAGIHILCVVLSFSDFVSWLSQCQGVSKQDIEGVIQRIVKCLTSKRKYNRNAYDGRQLKRPAELNPYEKTLKKFMQDLIEHRSSQNQQIRLQLKIKRVSADMHYHIEIMKQEKGKQIFSKSEMREIYEKSRHTL